MTLNTGRHTLTPTFSRQAVSDTEKWANFSRFAVKNPSEKRQLGVRNCARVDGGSSGAQAFLQLPGKPNGTARVQG